MTVSAVSNGQTQSPQAVTGQDGARDYTVKHGDTLWDIARQHGVSLQALIAANPQIANPNRIYPGDAVHIPASSGGAGAGGQLGGRAPSNTGPAAPTGPGGVAPSGQGNTSELARQAMAYFESRGWSHAQAAGIVANLQTESGFRPGAVGDGGHAYGIAQWHEDRQAGFRRFTGHDIRGSSFAEQLAYVDHELRTSEAGAGAQLGRATTASEAGAIVSRAYERPADVNGEASRRGALAAQIAR